MERDSPRVFQSRSLCYCLCAKTLRELPLPEGLVLCWHHGLCPCTKERFARRYFCENTQKEKPPKMGGCGLETQNCFPSWCLSWSRAQILCKPGLGFTWQSTSLLASWKGMTWPEGLWREWIVLLFFFWLGSSSFLTVSTSVTFMHLYIQALLCVS